MEGEVDRPTGIRYLFSTNYTDTNRKEDRTHSREGSHCAMNVKSHQPENIIRVIDFRATPATSKYPSATDNATPTEFLVKEW